MNPELSRRSFALLTIAGLLAACGASDGSSSGPGSSDGTGPSDTDGGDTSPDPAPGPAGVVAVGDREPGADGGLAGEAITRFGFALFSAITAGAADDAPVSISPASVAIALAMLEPGTVAAAQTELRALLSIDDAAAFHASMNGLEQSLEARTVSGDGGESGGQGDPGEITMRIANAAFLQPGYPFDADYLATVGRYYGPVLDELDFAADPDRAVAVINAFIDEATEGRITDPLGPGSVPPTTVLALVNTLFLTASWFTPFDESQTGSETFTLLDGTTVDVPMMSGGANSSRAGDGWVGAMKSHVGGISSQFIRPEADRFDDVATRLEAAFVELTEQAGPGGEFRMPRFDTRVDTSLETPLRALGLAAPFEEGNLLGIADDPTLVVDSIAHSTFVKYDEGGVEAAAATVIMAGATSAPADPPVPVVLDRPFFYRIVDQKSGATLFLGRIMDPTVG